MADEPDPEPYDAGASAVAAAQAQLEVARRSGRTGIIALAHFNLAGTLASLGDHASAAVEFRDLIGYLDLAVGDEQSGTERQLRMLSPAAPPPGAEDVDPAQVQAFARVELAKCLLELGRRDEARAELDLAASAGRGFGRGVLKRRIKDVRRRMDAAVTSPQAEAARRHPAARGGSAGEPGPAEAVAAADELLGAGRHAEAARVALAAIARCGPDQVATRARARQVLGMALDGMGQPDDAFAVLREAYSDYLTADEVAAAGTVVVALAWRRADAGDRAGGIELLRGALDAVGGRGGPGLRVRLLTDLGSLQDQADRQSDARTTFEAAVATAKTADDRELVADAQHGLAIVLATRGADTDDAVEALTLLDDCRRTYDESGLPDRAAGCEHEAAALLGRLGSPDAAAARYRRALDRYRALPADQRDTGSWPDEVADCEHNLATLEAHAHGQADAAPDRLLADPTLFRSGGHAMSHQR